MILKKLVSDDVLGNNDGGFDDLADIGGGDDVL